jgi:hypothetical protein
MTQTATRRHRHTWSCATCTHPASLSDLCAISGNRIACRPCAGLMGYRPSVTTRTRDGRRADLIRNASYAGNVHVSLVHGLYFLSVNVA